MSFLLLEVFKTKPGNTWQGNNLWPRLDVAELSLTLRVWTSVCRGYTLSALSRPEADTLSRATPYCSRLNRLSILTAPQFSGSSPRHTSVSSSEHALMLWSCNPPGPQFPQLQNGDANAWNSSFAELCRNKMTSIHKHLRYQKGHFLSVILLL